MKFAKELEHDAVPEWRIKYLNYKAGKKYVKAISRALARANATPRSGHLRTSSRITPRSTRTPHSTSTPGPQYSSGLSGKRAQQPGQHSSGPRSHPKAIPDEGKSLKDDGRDMTYGSFVPTPPMSSPTLRDESGGTVFELPAPAMRVPSEGSEQAASKGSMRKHLSQMTMRRSATLNHLPSDMSEATASQATAAAAGPPRKSATGLAESPSQLRRLFSHSSAVGRSRSSNEMRLESVQSIGLDLVRQREHEFFTFMDSELDKVDSFYKSKEEQAGARLTVLREQLHEMRNRRIQEIAQDERHEDHRLDDGDHDDRQDKTNGWVHPIKAKIFPPGPNSKALQSMPRTPLLRGDASRDYIRRPDNHDVSYRTAKRKLKLALQEFYRGLELLKSYALLNRTAFRKLNKKFDKAVNARPPYRYMNEKVNKSWFVTSDALEGHIKAVEDLYARYFEKGNHKLAAGKLRSLSNKSSDESGSSFLNGFLLGVGIVFTVQGLVYAGQILSDDEHAPVHVQTSYLLQIYGGYFLMWLIYAILCVDCFIWTKYKINYTFIFELEQRHHLDWRRLSEFGSAFFLLFGIFVWLNFSQYGPDSLYLYYPVILIGVTALIIFFPAPILAHRARQWFLYAHWRLLLAGFYPVEFRDFFLGDIYCSLTYAMANIELFFCLYSRKWDDPMQCNSNHSRALGFMTTLPGIWRLLQCLRRYKDTRNIFPHLVNGGKYGMTIMYYVTLSIYRIRDTPGNLALFITFAAINSFYCIVWDLFMDFSLLQTQARSRGLRNILAFKSRWPYYAIMVIDPVIRLIWVFYAVFTHDTQHSTIASFLLSLAEVLRRGLWAIFRVENEHCANVAQYKASRDVPLPYRIEPLMVRASAESSPIITPEQEQQQQEEQERQERQRRQQDPESITASSTAVGSSLTGGLRRRVDTATGTLPGTRSFSKILAEAHKQDFEKRRKPVPEVEDDDEEEHGLQSDEEDSEYEESAMEIAEAQALRRRGSTEE